MLVAAVLVLSACDRTDPVVEVVALGKADPAQLNTVSRSPAGLLLRGAVADGLVGLDEKGQVIPALADRWIVEDDGLSYIFRLRLANWPDGSPISAASVQLALRQTAASLRGTPLALDLASLSEIRVMTGRVIELRLKYPQPDLLMVLAQPELSLLRKGRGAGPMRMVREGAVATLTPIEPEKRGLTAIADWQERSRKVHLRSLPAAEAIAQFAAGKASLVVGGTIADMPSPSIAGSLRNAIQFDPVEGLFGLAIAQGDGFLAEQANREAIAMAIDRTAMLAGFDLNAWRESVRPLPAGLSGVIVSADPPWLSQTLAERQATAADRVNKWRGGKAAPQLRLAMPTGTGADLLYQKLAESLKQIGLETIRVNPTERADLRLIDTVASYPRAAWYFNQLSCANRRGLCSSEADRLIAEAANAPDLEKRAELVAQAEATLIEANVFIPFGPPVRWSLVRGSTTGFAVNRSGYHPLMPLALLPK